VQITLALSSTGGWGPAASAPYLKPEAVTVPYIDIDPHRSRPKWMAYVGLGILTVVTGLVVFWRSQRGS
jgi:hypothetical protein